MLATRRLALVVLCWVLVLLARTHAATIDLGPSDPATVHRVEHGIALQADPGAVGALVLATMDGAVRGVDPSTGRSIWQLDTGGATVRSPEPEGPPGRGEARLVPSVDGSLYSLPGRGGGAALYRFPLTVPELVAVSPAVAPDGSLYLGTKTQRHFAVDPFTGKMSTVCATEDDEEADIDPVDGPVMGTLDIVRSDFAIVSGSSPGPMRGEPGAVNVSVATFKFYYRPLHGGPPLVAVPKAAAHGQVRVEQGGHCDAYGGGVDADMEGEEGREAEDACLEESVGVVPSMRLRSAGSGVVEAVDPVTGAVLWVKALGAPVLSVHQVSVDDGLQVRWLLPLPCAASCCGCLVSRSACLQELPLDKPPAQEADSGSAPWTGGGSSAYLGRFDGSRCVLRVLQLGSAPPQPALTPSRPLAAMSRCSRRACLCPRRQPRPRRASPSPQHGSLHREGEVCPGL